MSNVKWYRPVIVGCCSQLIDPMLAQPGSDFNCAREVYPTGKCHDTNYFFLLIERFTSLIENTISLDGLVQCIV